MTSLLDSPVTASAVSGTELAAALTRADINLGLVAELAQSRGRRDAWRQHAACRHADPDVFHPDDTEGSAAAREICRGCDARHECLAAALRDREPDGIWGGLDGEERAALRVQFTEASIDIPDGVPHRPLGALESLLGADEAPAAAGARLRPDQDLAVSRAVAALRRHGRAQIHMACGTGKTRVGAAVASALGASRVLVLVPSLALVSQLAREWGLCGPGFTQIIGVCSDRRVGLHGDEPGFPVAKTAEQLACAVGHGATLVVATYQSSHLVAEAMPLIGAFDLVVCDEAHRLVGRIDRHFSTVLDDTKIDAAYRLFLTATPKILDDELGDVVDMGERAAFGPVAHILTFADAVRLGLICDFKVLLVGVDSPAADLGGRAGARAVSEAMARHGISRALTFHSRVRFARRFAAALRDVGTAAEVLSGKTPGDERRAAKAWLASGPEDRRVVCNVRVFSEGVDVPSLDAVAFCESGGSEVSVTQAVGRAVRTAPGKTVGYVIMPVAVDPDETLSADHINDSYRLVGQVLRNLRALDDNLGVELDSARRHQAATQRPPTLPTRIQLDLPAGDSDVTADRIRTAIVEQAAADVQEWLGLIERFAAREGHTQVPAGHLEGGQRLDLYVARLRVLHRRGVLAADLAERLSRIPGWEWAPPKWQPSRPITDFLGALDRYVAREGHADVPADHVEDEMPLGRWVVHVRWRRGWLDADVRTHLDGLPGWQWTDTDRRLAGAAALQANLGALLDHPGRWARIARYAGPGSAGAQASMLRSGRYVVPAGRWEFLSRRNDEGGSDLLACYHGPTVDVQTEGLGAA